MIQCKKCNGKNIVKSGFTRGLQRYKCKDCGCNFTNVSRKGKPQIYKIIAVLLYSSGKASYRFIAKMLQVSAVSVYKWIREFAEQIGEPEILNNYTELELDEMWHYVGSKKTENGYGKHMIGFRSELSPGSLVTVVFEHSANSGQKSNPPIAPTTRTAGMSTKS